MRKMITMAGSLAVFVLGSTSVYAQNAGCTMTQENNPPRYILQCPDGLTISAEQDADYNLVDRNGDGKPEGVELRNKAILIDLPPGSRPGGFQILTPHAVASVRGTSWAVDVTRRQSSVFVERGSVGVKRSASPDSIVLRAGQGVDVGAGAGPLRVQRWSSQRATRFLARFGR